MNELPAPVIEARDVWRTYRRGSEDLHALAGVSLHVREREMVAVVGRSGSGKTTLLNQIGCLDAPSRGSIRVCGVEVTGMAERDLVTFRRDHIGFIFQLFYLIPTLSAVENVELPMVFAREKDRRRRALDALERVGFGNPHAFPGALSGGELQRVAVARALVRQPRILLADEPTGRLEHGARDDVMAIFRRLRDDGLGVVIVTHDPMLAAQTDRVVALEDGRLAAGAATTQEGEAET
jgi:putative ABC transport system ATP-binding protein